MIYCMYKILAISVFLTWFFPLSAQVILIDPGHGGDDCGAKTWLGRKVKICEKKISLDLAKLIQKELKSSFKVYLTRSFDREISLEKRAEQADRIKADIFISVHANASPYRSSNGFETYYLDNHDNKAVKKVEGIENRGLKGEELVVNEILVDLVIQKTAPQSRALGRLIHQSIAQGIKKKYKKAKDRGAKPALFYVLALSKRPAVLLEAGFMSNPKDRDRLLSKKYQTTYAKAVAKGIRRYFKKYYKKPPPLF